MMDLISIHFSSIENLFEFQYVRDGTDSLLSKYSFEQIDEDHARKTCSKEIFL